ncbi:uncharacterized protein TNCV_4905901 [Trichonephila clavipes]|uniref:Uncharacterized protein n=1 Tax=Trichonephila clavipes TaxID=2585209 RepID=A0A8X6RSE4_TRICX|nr:uncharacterized protein TNCV_4905901 [Trichonephila clavipes]
MPAGWRSWFVAGLPYPGLRVRHQPRAQVPPSGEETGLQNYLRKMISPKCCRTKKLYQLLGNVLGLQSDDSTFEILQNKAQFLRRLRGEKFHSDCVIQTVKHPTKIVIWSVISGKGTGCMYVVKEEVNTAEKTPKEKSPEILDTLRSSTDARDFYRLQQSLRRLRTLSLPLIDFQIYLDSLRPKVIYEGSHLRASQ